MVRTNIFDDTFEKLVEFGNTTAKKTVQSIKQTFSPLKISEQILGLERDESLPNKTDFKEKKPNNHTPLNFEQLGKQYKQQDIKEQTILKQRFFQLIKQGDEKILQEKRQNIEQQRFAEEQKKAEEAKKRKIALQQSQDEIIPRGKVRRSIFSPKKLAQQKHAEVKPSTGKN
jgi:hypothetical protein